MPVTMMKPVPVTQAYFGKDYVAPMVQPIPKTQPAFSYDVIRTPYTGYMKTNQLRSGVGPLIADAAVPGLQASIEKAGGGTVSPPVSETPTAIKSPIFQSALKVTGNGIVETKTVTEKLSDLSASTGMSSTTLLIIGAILLLLILRR